MQYGTFIISNCYFHDNIGTTESVIDCRFAESLTIVNSTIAYNESEGFTNGIAHIQSTDFVMMNTTVCHNGENSFGGCIRLYNTTDTVPSCTITNCTIAENTSSFICGGLLVDGVMLYLKNTIIANNSSDLNHQSGTVIDNGNNIVEDENSDSLVTTGTTYTGDQSNLYMATDLAINNAANNIPTLALLSGSIAIDAGDDQVNNGVVPSSVDQRGFDRNSSYDIGAYEYNASYTDTSPTVTSIKRSNPASANTNDTSVTFRITFSEDVKNVDAADFSLTTTGTASGTIDSVSLVNSWDFSVYDVTITSVSGAGTLRLDLNSSGTDIADSFDSAIASGFTSGETYTLDATAPTVTGITRQSPSSECTNAISVTFRIAFSEDVTGVDTTDFALTTTGTAAGTVASVSAVSASVYDVTVSSVSGDGTIRLDLGSSGTGIADSAGIAIASGMRTVKRIHWII